MLSQLSKFEIQFWHDELLMTIAGFPEGFVYFDSFWGLTVLI